MVQSKLLLNFREIRHYFFDKTDTKTNTRYKDMIAGAVTAEQIHSNKVAYVTGKSKQIKGVDALVTDKYLDLGIRTADCLPVIFFDRKKKLIAVVHAGWQGLIKGIIKNTVFYLKKLGGQQKEIFVAIGPHIGNCCYDVDYDRVSEFKKVKISTNIFIRRNSRWFIDLAIFASQQMIELGISKENIDVLPYCTFCNTEFYSFRRDKNTCERMYSLIGLIK